MQVFKGEQPAANRNCGPWQGRLCSILLLTFMLVVASFTTASDTRLAELLRDNLKSAGLDTSSVSFEEHDGTVTLSGRVADARQKQVLLDLVRRTHGVREVIDNLKTDFDS